MCPTFPLIPDPAPLLGGDEFLEPVATLTEDERAYLDSTAEGVDRGVGSEGEGLWEFDGTFEFEADVEAAYEVQAEPEADVEAEFAGEVEAEFETEFEAEFEAGLIDQAPDRLDEWEDTEAADDIAEGVAGALAKGGASSEAELQVPRPRWTTCFTADESARTVRVYEQNVDAAASDPPGQHVDRCSCIVMLNVGLGQLLGLTTRDHPARGFKTGMPRRPRRVQMAALTTETIELAMRQLVRAGRATGPIRIDFTDRRGRRAGTLPPIALQSSVLAAVTARTPDAGCWYGFGLSLMDGFHSVLLLVDHTGATPRIWWLDQFSRGLDTEVTTTLDAKITTFTQTSWQRVLDTKGKRFSTPVRLWRLRKRTN